MLRAGQRFVWREVLLEIPAIRIRRDRAYLSALYHRVVGRSLRLDPPVTLGEKITHRMLYERNSLHTVVADKLAVRQYVAARVGPEVLPRLYAQQERVDRALLDAVPVPCIIKTSHGCGGHRVITSRDALSAEEIIRHFDAQLQQNYYNESREYHYKHIPPRILVEELLTDTNGRPPADYKFHMFHGRLGYVQIDVDRAAHHRRLHLGSDLAVLPVTGRVPAVTEPFTLPANIDEMITLATTLSADFDFVRVDLYNLSGRIVFGELTLTPHAGRLVLDPPSYDEQFGQLWDYPPV